LSEADQIRFRFTIRDLLWLTLVVALAVGWWSDRRGMQRHCAVEFNSYGLGFQVGGDAQKFFGMGKAGFYSHFVGYVDTGRGAAVLVNCKTQWS